MGVAPPWTHLPASFWQAPGRTSWCFLEEDSALPSCYDHLLSPRFLPNLAVSSVVPLEHLFSNSVWAADFSVFVFPRFIFSVFFVLLTVPESLSILVLFSFPGRPCQACFVNEAFLTSQPTYLSYRALSVTSAL